MSGWLVAEKTTRLTPWLSHSNFSVTSIDTNIGPKSNNLALADFAGCQQVDELPYPTTVLSCKIHFSLNLKRKGIKTSARLSFIMKLTPLIIHYSLEWLVAAHSTSRYSWTLHHSSGVLHMIASLPFAMDPYARVNIYPYLVKTQISFFFW